MKGTIESFSAELDRGIIFGDDKNNYNFSSSNWKNTKKSPRCGLKVVFETEDKQAVEIYLAKAYIKYLRPFMLAGLFILFFGVLATLPSLLETTCGCISPDSEARQRLRFWVRAQQAYYFEMGEFADSNDLDSIFKSEDKRYNFQNFKVNRKGAIMIAYPKDKYKGEELLSFISSVTITDDGEFSEQTCELKDQKYVTLQSEDCLQTFKHLYQE